MHNVMGWPQASLLHLAKTLPFSTGRDALRPPTDADEVGVRALSSFISEGHAIDLVLHELPAFRVYRKVIAFQPGRCEFPSD